MRSHDRVICFCLVCLGGLTLLAAGPAVALAEAPFQSTPDRSLWTTNGTANAMATAPDGTMYVGGGFSYVGPVTGPAAVVDAATGALLHRSLGVDGEVLTAIPDGSGGFFIGGDFTNVRGVVRKRIAHLRADGTVDPDFDPGANGPVRALAISGSIIYAGGDFTTIGDRPRSFLAAVRIGDGVVTSWNPSVGPAGCMVDALAVSGSTVYAGGRFYLVGEQFRSCIAAIDAVTGTPTSWDPHADNIVTSLVVSGSLVYMAGGFDTVGGVTRRRVAAVDTAGLATSWDARMTAGLPEEMSVSEDSVYLAGESLTFESAGNREGVAAVDRATGALTAFDAQPNASVYAMALSGSTLYVGGSFTAIGGEVRTRFAALDASTGAARPFDCRSGGVPAAIAVSATSVFVGGQFTSIGGERATALVALSGSTGAATGWDAGVGPVGTVPGIYDLALRGPTLYVAGWFSTIRGEPRQGLAAVDTATGDLTAWDPAVADDALCLAVTDDAVYVGFSASGDHGVRRGLRRPHGLPRPDRRSGAHPTRHG